MLDYLIIAAIVATAGVLLVGILSMSRGGDFNRKNSNKLMRLRIIMQAIALVLIMLSLWLGASGS
ncbi:twin transmembrane helix small protein [Sneathiella chinensis]|uniref:Membrane protein n=1 Tax=Sneathiella chinensis TaxID=349750 RepID=A0ABQ5U0T7_9PROT|nr:twin transmembrane helix small protein [Sneathiella chinensis]GLQ05338.1 membrane protein [Sneathiella chinensis]